MNVRTQPKQASVKRMLCNDVRRELRWGYKDQSVRNINEILRKIERFAKSHQSVKAQRTSIALAQYVNSLRRYRDKNLSLNDLKSISIALLDLVRDWELSQETSARV